MASKLNTEFNYRYQVIGETIWEKIKTLQGFLEGRIRASVLEEVAEKKYQAKIEKLKWLKETTNLKHEILDLEADILETESFFDGQKQSFKLNLEEIELLKRLLEEAFEVAEPTRIKGYTDEQMFEANAANEFSTMIGRDMLSELAANGRVSPAKMRNAMSNPMTFKALQKVGLIPEKGQLLIPSNDPLKIEFDFE